METCEMNLLTHDAKHVLQSKTAWCCSDKTSRRLLETRGSTTYLLQEGENNNAGDCCLLLLLLQMMLMMMMMMTTTTTILTDHQSVMPDDDLSWHHCMHLYLISMVIYIYYNIYKLEVTVEQAMTVDD